MTITVKEAALISVLALIAATGCSTMSRTEKQLAKVVSYDSPDIPALGVIPPVRPRTSGLAYSKNTLLISYDDEVGKEPLFKAAKKVDADIVYDYGIISVVAVRIPEGKTLEESVKYFQKVKGVIQVSMDSIFNPDNPSQTELLW